MDALILAALVLAELMEVEAASVRLAAMKRCANILYLNLTSTRARLSMKVLPVAEGTQLKEDLVVESFGYQQRVRSL